MLRSSNEKQHFVKISSKNFRSFKVSTKEKESTQFDPMCTFRFKYSNKRHFYVASFTLIYPNAFFISNSYIFGCSFSFQCNNQFYGYILLHLTSTSPKIVRNSFYFHFKCNKKNRILLLQTIFIGWTIKMKILWTWTWTFYRMLG